ncbi:MAG: YibE/F family protein [Thermoleophilaceae bacterium]|nr:YibE/F family protein [Thermoleophilaceae bacterium]
MNFNAATRTVTVLVGVICAVTVAGLVLLWPTGESKSELAGNLKMNTVAANVVASERVPCGGPSVDGSEAGGETEQICLSVKAKLSSAGGKTIELRTGGTASDPRLAVGDAIRVSPAGAGTYSFVDYERKQPIMLLAFLFALIVVVFGRWRGFLALIGLAASLLIVLWFIVPAILDGEQPVAVAIIGAFAVMLVTLGLTHGVGLTSRAAALGTATALLLTAALAVIFIGAGNITGFSSEEATILNATGGNLSLSGLVLAGIIIAALGVLDDLTVSQASAVLALRQANPTQGFKQLYRGALGIGRDHVAATVNTLVLAYVGASLPVLLIFSVGGTSASDALNSEAVAEQIIGTLVGSIGLIAAVPITTAIAAMLASKLPADAVIDTHAGHAH